MNQKINDVISAFMIQLVLTMPLLSASAYGVASTNTSATNNTKSTQRDSGPPPIEVSIPQYFNKNFIDISGTTRPFSSVTLYVNDFNAPRRNLNTDEIGESGQFAFAQVQLDKQNKIKIVVEDKSGNKNEKTFDVTVDKESPIIKIEEIKNLVSKLNFTISGNVNKPLTIKLFIDLAAEQSSVPAKVTGLQVAKANQNSIELKWDESKDKDFSHYVVYRDDVGPIAKTNPASYNNYIDALVDSNKEYRYEVSSVNIFDNEGAKSDPIIAKTLPGGKTLGLKPNPIDVLEESRKPTLTVEANGDFNFVVRLDKGDGKYNLKLVFEDKAGNKFTSEKIVTLDSKKPTVKITSPSPGAQVYENLANEINIIGKTKPNARVHLFVDRTPFGAFNTSIQVTGIPNEAQNVPNSSIDVTADFESKLEKLPESELESKCESLIASRAACKEGADKSVTADSEGNFKFEKVDLTAAFGLSTRLTEVSPSEFRDTRLNQEAQQAKKSNILVIATDQSGLRGYAKETINIGTCWSGNQSWDLIPLTSKQSPIFLSTERLAEGTEALYFYFNFSYIGRGANAKIENVFLSRACGTREVLDPRFNISCRVMPAGDMPTKLNPDGTLTYSVVPLTRYEGMDRFLRSDWKSFFDAIGVNKDMTFPFKVTIRYKHDVIDDTGVIRTMTEAQSTCQEVSYVVDNTLIDPRIVLPDFLVNDFVNFLDNSIKTLAKVQEQIDRVVDYVAIGCLYSFFAHLIFKVYRNIVDLSSEKIFTLKTIAFNTGNSQNDQDCAKIAEAVKKAHGSMKLKYFSDPDLKKCFPASYAAWQREYDIYQVERWGCDRIFGHTSPSKWTETRSDDDIVKTLSTPNTCSNDGVEWGQPLTAVDCSKIEGKYHNNIVQINHFGQQPIGQKCFEIHTDPNNPGDLYVYTLYENKQESRLLANNIYKLEKYEGRPTTAGIIYAQKLPGSDTQYITKQLKTCEELCGFNQQQATSKITVNGKEYVKKEGKLVKKEDILKPITPAERTTYAACVPVNDCRQWYAKARESSTPSSPSSKPSQNQDGIQIDETVLTSYSIENKGYASDCFYQGDQDNPDVVSPTNANTRQVCCCINGKASAAKDIYYQPDDVDVELEKTLPEVLNGQQLSVARDGFIHQSKSPPDGPPKGITDPDTGEEQKFSDMKWSYRYWKIGYLNKKYNPNRYVEGRDVYACFGQDNLFYKIIPGKEKEVVTLNPFKESSAALQCAYLTGINQRLQEYKNIMGAMSSCLTTIKTNGRADAGVCKELFTQHVCGLIWQLVRFFIDGCTPEEPGVDADSQDDSVAQKLKLGFKGIAQGISESQQEFSDEYQNAKLNNLLGIGEGGVARKVCLAAFGYDWSLTSRNLIDAAYAAPFATLVQPITKSREFLTIDPVTLRPTYEYRASWIINPGCDLDNYKAELVCVTRRELDEYPNSVNCGAVGAPSIAATGSLGTSTGYNQCDCLDAVQVPSPYTINPSSTTRLKQNVFKEEDFHRVITSQYRYDHIKFTLRPDRRIPANMQKNCFPTGYEKGVFYFPITDNTARDIEDCTVDPLSGSFKCGVGADFYSNRGIAQIIEVNINGQNPEKLPAGQKELQFEIGDPLKVGARVTKSGKDKCLRISVSPDIISPAIAGVTVEGTNEIEPQTLVDRLTVAGRSGNVIAPGITFKPRSQNNPDPVIIHVVATDNENKEKSGYVDGKNYIGTFSPDDTLLIDDWTINFQTSQPEDISGRANKETKIRFEGNNIVVEKLGAVIEISGLSYQSPLKPGDPYKLDTQIQINPAQQSTGTSTSQEKTITVELFNIKSTSESYATPSDCNFNDKMDQKSYKFRVSDQSVDYSKTGPTIQTPRVNPSRPIVGQTAEISVRISQPGGLAIKDNGVTITIVGKDGNKIVDNAIMQYLSENVGYLYSFDTSGQNLQPGMYPATIQAISVNGEKSLKTFSIDLAPSATTPITTGAATTTKTPTIDTTPKIPSSRTYNLEEFTLVRPNFADVDTIILHHSATATAVDTYNALRGDKNSAHYIIDRDGTIYYAVDEKLSAQHAGTWNSRSIGIEIVNTGYRNMQYTNEQYGSIKRLISDIVSRWPKIKYDDQHVLGHYQVSTDGKWDPSPNFDWSRIDLPNHLILTASNIIPSTYGYG